MTPQQLLALFKERGALLEGHFQLSSGLHSSGYLQCARVLMDPALATRLGAALAESLREALAGATTAAGSAPASASRKDWASSAPRRVARAGSMSTRAHCR